MLIEDQDSILCEQCVINEITKYQLVHCTCKSISSESLHKIELIMTEMLKRIGGQEEKYAIVCFKTDSFDY